ncbi:multiple organellar RNA editing factor 2, chloroplastic-like [Tasmannia lanceolata]|uniref:multiple organellar RNA editing factor 2, chloroplastic-like n=1 Tax=Tasmannia lanceolata TaxID=3420 RepID=UPI004062915C
MASLARSLISRSPSTPFLLSKRFFSGSSSLVGPGSPFARASPLSHAVRIVGPGANRLSQMIQSYFITYESYLSREMSCNSLMEKEYFTEEDTSYITESDESNISDNEYQIQTMDRIRPGFDFHHWLIIMDLPGGEDATKKKMIDCYIQTLAKVLGSEEEAKKKIYNVSCERYLGFGCEIDRETSKKMEGLAGVLFVIPDCYKDIKNKDYGAELLVNGEMVQTSPERQRRMRDIPKRAPNRPPYNRFRYLMSRESLC